MLGGQPRVHPPVWHVGEGLALTVGTRGALGPQSVSRYLDLYGVTGNGVVTVYVRDLDSTVDRTYGFGAGIHGVRYGRLSLGLAADAWKEPAARELLGRDLVSSSWNVDGEIEAPLGARWGLAAKLGAKSRGFLPGKPQDRGAYVGFGLTAVW